MNRDEFIVCREYAAMDLAFSMYNLHEGLREDQDEEDGRRELFGASERGFYEWFTKTTSELLSATDDGDARRQLEAAATAETEYKGLRREITKRMEFFTAITDRFVAYEYVLNRYELKFAPEEKLDEFLRANPEDAFLNRIISYLTLERDKKIFGTKLQQLIGEIPVQMTKNKLFELIDRAFTLYIGSDETSLDELIYMLRMAGLTHRFDIDGADTDAVQTSSEESGISDFIREYPGLKKALKDFESVELKTMTESDYDRLRDEVFDLSGKLEFIMDHYYELQRCVNDALALCIVRKWLPEDDALMDRSERNAVTACMEDEIDDAAFTSLEGRIESVAERLHRQMSGVEAPDMNAEEEEEYLDVATLARLLSNSIFAEIDPLFVEEKTVTRELIKEKEAVLFDELESVFKDVQKPVKKAVMAKLIEKLPPFLTDQAAIEEYIRLNLFNCRDKAERCAVMAIITEMMEDDG